MDEEALIPNEGTETTVSRWYWPDLILNYIICLSVAGFGSFMLYDYGPTTDLDSDAPIEEIPDAPMSFCLAFMFGVPFVTLVTVSRVAINSLGFRPKRKHFIIRRMYPKLITTALFVVVGQTLYDNQSSVDLTYVESWPAIVFMASTTAFLVMAIEIIRCGNVEKYLKKLTEACGIPPPPQQVHLNNVPDTSNEGHDKIVRAINIITFSRFGDCLLSIVIFARFSLKYGLETFDTIESDDFIFWGVIQAINLLGTALLVKYSGYIELPPIDVGGKTWGRFWPEIMMLVIFILNLIILCAVLLSGEEMDYWPEAEIDYWPTIVASSHLFCVVFVSCFLP